MISHEYTIDLHTTETKLMKLPVYFHTEFNNDTYWYIAPNWTTVIRYLLWDETGPMYHKSLLNVIDPSAHSLIQVVRVFGDKSKTISQDDISKMVDLMFETKKCKNIRIIYKNNRYNAITLGHGKETSYAGVKPAKRSSLTTSSQKPSFMRCFWHH